MVKSGARPQQGPPFFVSFIWLAYMIYPITTLIGRPMNEMVPGFALVVLFAVIYIYSFLRSRGRFLSILVQLVIVGFFVYRYHQNFIYMAFYPSPLIGLMNDRKRVVAAIVALMSVFGFTIWTYKLYIDMAELIQFIPLMLVMSGMPLGIRAGRRSRELREQLNLANEEIAHLSKNEERQRISRDLHDTLGHTLSLITLKSELAEKLITKNPDRAIQEVKDIQLTSRAALKQVRELVSGMNTVTIRDEITNAKQILAAAGMVLEAKGEFGKPLSAPVLDNILGMCLREAVTNVVKHSKSKRCKVEWTEEMGSYLLKVTDYGEGADRENCNAGGTKNGLNGIRERLKLVNGEMQFESIKGQGTSVSFKVPQVNRSNEVGESKR